MHAYDFEELDILFTVKMFIKSFGIMEYNNVESFGLLKQDFIEIYL